MFRCTETISQNHKKENMKIITGLSGGVDSAVAALLLKKQGHEVIGITMSIWNLANKFSSQGHKNACYGPNEQEDIEEARKIAKKIDIPYYVFDCVSEYERIVLNNFKSEYLCGHTPNPCVLCNALVKFGVLPQLAAKSGINFDKFATGHYARIENINGRYVLKKGIDEKKDQSYFLYRLSQEQLEKTIFPLGSCTKEYVRKIAFDYGISAAEKPDSQDFYGGNYNELLSVKAKEGKIIDTEGKILGKHNGIWNYTTGQRKGLNISSSEPLYIVELRKDTNEVVVGHLDKTFKKSLTAKDLNWVGIKALTNPINASAKIRSSQKPVNAKIYPEGNNVKVVFEEYQKSITKGQSVVLYDGDIVLGGGIITEAE